MHLELTDEQTEALIRELSQLIDGVRYPLSPRIVVLKEILGMMRPEPARPAPLPRAGITSPPSKGRYARVMNPRARVREGVGAPIGRSMNGLCAVCPLHP
jgi:hypothetical protein